MAEYIVKGGRRSGHGADVDDKPDPCKVMAWGVNVSIKPCRARRRVRQEEVRVQATAAGTCAGACGQLEQCRCAGRVSMHACVGRVMG